jgi:hypothetical protein
VACRRLGTAGPCLFTVRPSVSTDGPRPCTGEPGLGNLCQRASPERPRSCADRSRPVVRWFRHFLHGLASKRTAPHVGEVFRRARGPAEEQQEIARALDVSARTAARTCTVSSSSSASIRGGRSPMWCGASRRWKRTAEFKEPPPPHVRSSSVVGRHAVTCGTANRQDQTVSEARGR